MTQNLRQRKALAVALHPAMSHAQAQKVCQDIGAEVVQDGRGNARLNFKPCPYCRSPLCADFEWCARTTPPEAA